MNAQPYTFLFSWYLLNVERNRGKIKKKQTDQISQTK